MSRAVEANHLTGVLDERLVLRKQNCRLLTALRRIVSLAEKNVPKYAQQIAREAINQQNTSQPKDAP